MRGQAQWGCDKPPRLLCWLTVSFNSTPTAHPLKVALPLSRQTPATRMNCGTTASLSALSWQIRAVNFGYILLDSNVAIESMVCIRRNNGWNTLVKHQPRRILQINVFLAQANDFHTMLWSNLSKIWIFGTSELKQNICANTIMLTSLLCFGFFFSGVAVSPRQPNWPPD